MRGKTCRNAALDKPHDRAAIARAVHRPEDGATLVLTAILLVILFAIGYVGVNWAVAVAARVSAQRAADAAALAGCLDLPDKEKAVASAQRYGASAGGLNANTSFNLESGQGDQVLLDPPPGRSAIVDSDNTSSVRTGEQLQNNRITVHVRRTQWLFGIPNWPPLNRVMPVAARAVCVRNEGGAPVLHSLSTVRDSFVVNQAQLSLPRGGVEVGRTDCAGGDPKTMEVNGGGSVTARWIELCTGGQPFLASSSGINPPATHGWRCDEYGENQPPVCRFVPEPSSADRALFPNDYRSRCPDGRNPVKRGSLPFCVFNSGTVPSGVYPGLELSGQVTLSGNYYLDGSGLRVQEGARVTGQPGQSVFVFIGPDRSGSNCGSNNASVTFQQNSSFVVTPPTSGTYKDLVLFQSRNCRVQGGSNKNSFDIQGGVTMGSPDPPYGVIYLPTAHIDIGPEGTGGTQTVINMRVIAYEIRLRGPVYFGDIWVPSGDVKHGDIHLVE